MNNRRKQLMLASAKEYCKCAVEGNTLKYNNVANPVSGTISTWENISTFTAISGHKYAICINVSRQPNDYNDTDYQVYVVGFGTTYYGITQFKALIVTSDTSGTIEIASAVYDNFGGNVDFNLMVIDLTALGLTSVNNENDFYATDLGKYIAKGNYLPYEPNGKFIHAQSPINFEGRNMLSLNRTQGTLTGWDITNPRGFKESEYYLGLSVNNYLFPNNITYFSKTNDSVSVTTSSSSYGVAIPIKVKPNKHYKLSFNSSYAVSYRIGWYDKNGYIISYNDNSTGEFVSPNNAYWGSILLFSRANELCTYKEIIFCEASEYQNKYEPYCNNSVFESGLTLYKGDKYKTYSIDEISYNNLIPNANQDYVNSNADTRASIILSAFDYTNNIDVFAEGISAAGFYEFAFTSNTTTNGAKIYNSGVSINQNFAENISLTNGHKYYLSLKISSCDASFVGGLRIANLRLIDLTELGLNALTDKLRIFLQKNYKLPYTMTNKTIKDQIVRTAKEIDLSTLTWESSSPGYKAEAPNDIKLSGNTYFLLFEKYILGYIENQMALNGKVYIQILNATSSPTGKMLYELETPEIITDYPMNILITSDNLSYDSTYGTQLTLPNGLDIAGENGEAKVELVDDTEGFIVSSVLSANQKVISVGYWEQNKVYFDKISIRAMPTFTDYTSYLLGKTFRVYITNAPYPTRMVSRRTINVESGNDIDLDFTKE